MAVMLTPVVMVMLTLVFDVATIADMQNNIKSSSSELRPAEDSSLSIKSPMLWRIETLVRKGLQR